MRYHRPPVVVALVVAVVSTLGVAVRAHAAASDVAVVRLRTDGASELLGTDNRRPRLEWQLEAQRRGVLQSAYQVLVASSPARLTAGRADLWDSSRVAAPRLPTLRSASTGAALGAERTSRVRAAQPFADYAGRPLASRTRYWWTVRVWDERGRASAFAAPTFFETAFLDPAEWRARWIAGAERTRRDGVDALLDPETVAESGDFCRPTGPPGPLALASEPRRDEYIARWSTSCRAVRPAPLLRRRFEVRGEVARARLYVSGLGYAEVEINGRRVGGASVLEPGYTDYGRTVLYVTHDVTDALRAGDNVLGVELGSGFFDYDVVTEWAWTGASWRADPRVKLALHVDYADGRSQVVRSDGSWTTADGPTRYDNINIGETWDARFAHDGWSAPGFDDSGWAAARLVDAPAGTLAAETHEPIAVVETRAPLAVSEPQPGVRVYDFGVQTTGWVELTFAAPRGAAAEVRYAEDLLPDGTADLTRNLHIADRLQTDYLVSAGGAVRWRPRFSYKGFRYVQVSGPRETALAGEVSALEAQVVRSAVRSTARFASDSALLEDVYAIVARTIANNLHGIVTDTPVYEKNGWTGDAQLTAPTAAALFDLRRFYAKWMRDMRDAQRPDGELPVIVPTGGRYGFTGVGWPATWGATPAWDAALFLIPWEVAQRYGDERVLEDSYAAMRRYVDDFLPAWTLNGVVESELGDWLTPSAPLTKLVPSAYATEFVRRVALYADLLGKPADRDRYRRRHVALRAAFNDAFFADTRVYRESADEPFAQTAQVVPLAFDLVPASERAALVDAVARDVAQRGGNLATGIVGTRYLLKELTAAGAIDVAFGIATQTDRPSWGEWLALGYTSLLENWGPAARSQDHHMFGSIGQWMLEDLAGIEPLTAGYAAIELRPEVPSQGLSSVDAALDTVRGEVAASWRKTSQGFALDVVVPAGSVATVHVPSRRSDSVHEVGEGSARAAEEATAVELISQQEDRRIYRIGSGRYGFRVASAAR